MGKPLHNDIIETFFIKCFSKARMTESDRIKYKREVSIRSKLAHPNIVKLHELYEDDRNLYMLMEPVVGASLLDRLLDVGKFTERQTRDCIISLIDSMCYLHDEGIIYRNINPEIMRMTSNEITRSGFKVTDLSMARRFHD